MTKPLSAEQAQAFLKVLGEGPLREGCLVPPIDAIATGQHQVIDTAESVAVKPLTEKEARQTFEMWFFAHRDQTPTRYDCYRAALLQVGAVIDEKEGG